MSNGYSPTMRLFQASQVQWWVCPKAFFLNLLQTSMPIENLQIKSMKMHSLFDEVTAHAKLEKQIARYKKLADKLAN